MLVKTSNNAEIPVVDPDSGTVSTDGKGGKDLGEQGENFIISFYLH
jgi:hypothetical protein